ncbi:hypothetical protein ARMSODRAFT_1019983 [Armillaria solidipes]|uniref:CxC2-like cysteine cluster KDZ transposase-associated domain-containing protein n=1 Tax=Armillaria solidipes TaxID=1076256 RepID=A0A2H3BTM2_9AGAR|nr:hypothetical protein ARMSODRAFT_1019983 [Armillaria solidipes]
MAVLKHFHMQTLCGKISMYKYYRGLNHMTDNTEINLPKTRYRSFFQMAHQLRHLLMMKCVGRGHIPDGIKTMKPGDLALGCIACLHPGENLPEGWENMPASEHVKKSTKEKDPGLHTGLAYFVDHDKYIRHVRKYASQKDISSCSGFQTLAHAETKNTHGLRATGMGICVCMRHEHVLPLAAGDLQVGERYCNMDYITGSMAQTFDDTKEIFYSYDIACQWKIKLHERMRKLPKHAQICDDMALDFRIPKLHCKAHKYACQCQFLMNLWHGLGCTCGEGIERTWDDINPCAASTKEMGPGAHHDTIDDQFGGHNWRKETRLGHLLHERQDHAVCQFNRQASAHMIFTESLPQDKNWAEEWTVMVEKWEVNDTAPNPYFKEVKSMAMGLLIEETQRRIRVDYKEMEENPLTRTQLKEQQDRQVTLQHQLTQFCMLQAAYMPCVLPLIEEAPAKVEGADDVEHATLWLPSTLTVEQQTLGCKGNIIKIEEDLCEAQCFDVLDMIRGVCMTRATAFMEGLTCKLEVGAAKYKVAQAALFALRGPGDWEECLRVLQASDIRTMDGAVFCIGFEEMEDDVSRYRKRKKDTENTHEGEGYRTVSWIWTTEGALGDRSDKQLHSAARVEWLKSRARVYQWCEELVLVRAEMQQCLKSLEY